MEFPKEVYVQVYEDNDTHDNDFLVVSPDKEEACDTDVGIAIAGEVVAIYELKKIVKMTKKITVKFSEKVLNG